MRQSNLILYFSIAIFVFSAGYLLFDVRSQVSFDLIFAICLMGFSSITFLVLALQSRRLLTRLTGEKEDSINLIQKQIEAIEIAGDGIAILDSEGRYTYLNRAHVKAYGYDNPDELLGHHWQELYEVKKRKWFEEFVIPDLEQNGKWQGETFGLKKDGSSFPEEVSLTKLHDGGMVCVVRDLSERRKQERSLRNRVAAIEASTDGIGIVQEDGSILFMNKALLQLHGLGAKDREDYLGKDWLSLYEDEGRREIEQYVLPAVQKTGEWRGEHKVRRKDGSVFWAETSLKRLEDGTMVGIVRDVEERKKSEREKTALTEQLYQAQKMEAIGRLAGGIAHDFNNILAAMMGNAEFLIEDLEDRPEQQKYSEKIYQAGEQAKELVDQMLSFSRRRESINEVVDIKKGVVEAASMLDASLPKSIELITNIDMSSAPIIGNTTQISQSIMNLCVNAKDAIEGEREVGRITLSLKKAEVADLPVRRYLYLETGTKSDGMVATRFKQIGGKTWLIVGFLERGVDCVHLEVADNGCGMDRGLMEHIFEPFFTTKAVDKGTGLGLASVHGVVLAHKGAMVVESAEGRGTVFHLFFPLASDFAQEVASSDEDVETFEQAGDYTIFIVDDQEDVLEMMSQKLSRLGYQTLSFLSALDVVDYLRENPDSCDLILSDQNMPKMSGVELAEQVEEDFPDLPVILVSGYAPELMHDQTKDRKSIKEILRKPVSSKVLAQKIQSVLLDKQAAV